MNRIYKFHSGAVVSDSTLNDREIRVVASDPTPDRVGDIMVPEGCVLDSYKSNPIVLANHDALRPIGSAQISIKNARVEALITFAPPKISALADEFCGLAKAGILNAVSVGFNPIEAEPIRAGGVRYNKWDLLELSVVSVPANPNAIVIERSAAAAAAASTSRLREIFELTARERRELRERQVIRREGLQELSEDGFKAWLRSKYPRSTFKDAKRSHSETQWSLTLHERFLLRNEQSDFAKWFARQSDFAERFARLEPIVRAAVTPPAREPIRQGRPIWRGSDAEYCAAWRDYDRGIANPWWRQR